MTGLLPYAPAALGVAGAIIAMAFDAWQLRRAALVGGVVLLVAGALAAGLSAATPVVGDLVMSGGRFSVAAAACLGLGAVALLACGRSLSADRAGSRLVALGALAASSSALVAAAYDVGVLFLGVEALALCGYAMVAVADTDRAREAAMKWFIQGSIATVVFVVGVAVLMGRTGGSLGYTQIGAFATSAVDVPMALGFVLILSALAFKIGAFPMHSWMPDAYETASPSAAAILSSAGKVGPLVAVVWLSMGVIGAAGARVLFVVAVLAACSIVFGNLAALRQRSLARMLAYSGIAQVGYALVGVPLGADAPVVLVFAILYGLTAAASFVLVQALHEADRTWDGTIRGLAGLSRRSPALAVSLAVIMFSLTGIPLTAGFWGKFLVFAGASVGGYLWLAIVGVLGSVVSFGYYGAAIRSAYIDEPATPDEEPAGEQVGSGRLGMAGSSAGVLAILIVVAGVAPMVWGYQGVLGALLR